MDLKLGWPSFVDGLERGPSFVGGLESGVGKLSNLTSKMKCYLALKT